MNLIEDPWMPVRRKDGSREWIAPDRLSDPDIVAFDADRADFNGALMQFAIGLLQTTTPVENPTAWKQLLHAPPSANALSEWFAPIVHAFGLDGDGPRFMQDLTVVQDSPEIYPVSALLIDSPADNAISLNKDHFVKRGHADALCPTCTAAGLFTLQTNAPSGGPGYRTGLRGGGPLTTLTLSTSATALWQNLWLNVLHRPLHLERNGRADKTQIHLRFPWMADFKTLQKDKHWEINPEQVHPDHVFWATPRRIRLYLDPHEGGRCALCDRKSEQLVRRFAAKNYGLNYKGAWEHPLTPQYEAKGEWLPLHPQPGGIGYRHWLGWVLGNADTRSKQRPARIVNYAIESRYRELGGAPRLWAFGYDMDNMKARCWYESSLPLYNLGECSKVALSGLIPAVSTLVNSADVAAWLLNDAVKSAWFSESQTKRWPATRSQQFLLSIQSHFWANTEAPFYSTLRKFIDTMKQDENAEPDTLETRQAWHRTLVGTALGLFENTFVGAGPIERQKPRRVAEARRHLVNSLHGKKMREVLRLPTPDKPATGSADAAPAEA